MEKGTLVRFKSGRYEEEDGMVYVVVEDNGDRCVIEAVNVDLAIKPQSVAKTEDLEAL